MNTDICARGFSLTAGLRSTVERESQEFQYSFPRGIGSIKVRLFDINGSTRGGADKGCLIHARLRGTRTSLVATAVDTDLYRAINTAFVKLMRGARAALHRTRKLQRNRRTLAPPQRRAPRTAVAA
jgi:ribosome-associated translation inhibitor RaiA